MDEQGLWKLFFATGSPLVWLLIRQEREGEQAKSAFISQEDKKMI